MSIATVAVELERLRNNLNAYLPGFDCRVTNAVGTWQNPEYYLVATKWGETRGEPIIVKGCELMTHPVNALAIALRKALDAIVWRFPPMMRPPKSGANADFGGGCYGTGGWA